MCTLVTIHEVTLVVPAANILHVHAHPMTGPVTLLHRHRRHAAQYFENTTLEDVPQEFCLFNEAQVFFRSLIQMFQIKANARWLQIMRYEFMRAINSTRDGLNAVKEELRPPRLMVVQHRYVLDMLTAMEGSVCRKLGSSCCTFIPANDPENGSITKAIEDLNNLEKNMIAEGGAQADVAMSWLDFSWMPSWQSALQKMCLPICGTLLLLC